VSGQENGTNKKESGQIRNIPPKGIALGETMIQNFKLT
jgi:hypothetical protein